MSHLLYHSDNLLLIYMLAVMMDNVSSNDVLACVLSKIVLQKYRIHFDPANARGRCMPHTVNLSAQTFLAGMCEAPNPEVEDYFPPNKHMPAMYNADEDELLQEHEAETDTIDLDQISGNDTYFEEWVDDKIALSADELQAPIKKVGL
jgi:hypothetical protein